MTKHHPDCDKEWWTPFNKLVSADECPTCRAHRSSNDVYCFEVLEQMHAGHGWTWEEREEPGKLRSVNTL
jgi:hypothetical protein